MTATWRDVLPHAPAGYNIEALTISELAEGDPDEVVAAVLHLASLLAARVVEAEAEREDDGDTWSALVEREVALGAKISRKLDALLAAVMERPESAAILARAEAIERGEG